MGRPPINVKLIEDGQRVEKPAMFKNWGKSHALRFSKEDSDAIGLNVTRTARMVAVRSGNRIYLTVEAEWDLTPESNEEGVE